MTYYGSYWVNRTLCAIIDDARSIIKPIIERKQLNNEMLCVMSLLEEIQVVGNRMEAGLEDKKDILKLRDEIKKLKKERDLIREELKEMGAKKKPEKYRIYNIDDDGDDE